jgi:hypothetical protein
MEITYLHKYSDPLLWDSKMELRCILFPLIILEMFLQIDWSPPVVYSIDWTWFGQAHTCLYKVPQLTVHVREKTKPWGRRNCRALRQDCVEAQIWGRVPRIVCSIEGSQEHSGFHHSWMEEVWNHQLFLELAAQPNIAMGGEGPWSGRWPRTWWSLWQSSRVPLWRWEYLPEGQPSLQHSTKPLW